MCEFGLFVVNGWSGWSGGQGSFKKVFQFMVGCFYYSYMNMYDHYDHPDQALSGKGFSNLRPLTEP